MRWLHNRTVAPLEDDSKKTMLSAAATTALKVIIQAPEVGGPDCKFAEIEYPEAIDNRTLKIRLESLQQLRAESVNAFGEPDWQLPGTIVLQLNNEDELLDLVSVDSTAPWPTNGFPPTKMDQDTLNIFVSTILSKVEVRNDGLGTLISRLRHSVLWTTEFKVKYFEEDPSMSHLMDSIKALIAE
eukprot:Protomagalhaensia_wolfi_Nauph_80__722@NODE_1410_length_1542_cov_405_388556_g1090_i0_p2_GENE_NODE_1410_length_1542_cov_405_388556_g1090_i0NODE_1410_length_1542_cov_405_388556_g1090_i0_p2_ORF_typecomplete_len200_score26_82_NODE_1410_length_1542_cov_405_388556_g1090_i09421496